MEAEEILASKLDLHRAITWRRLWLSFLGGMSAIWLPKPAAALIETELHLVLAFDASASVNDHEFRLQSAGTARALRDPTVLGAIGRAPGGVTVTVVQWASSTRQAVALHWTALGDHRSVLAFSHLVEAMPREISGGDTMIQAGLAYAARQFETAPEFADYEEAMRRKLLREIAGQPVS